ncbi:DNA (cytosine-5-)-methyltransferase [Actinomadura graeca]|uniref:DNA (cytosine-5-)-methyltransferase n=1 Tax=Actinomadura graeca TaxID=2750812 RepID=A0ABX8QLS7_9ACTN|nr:DNA (cytosine-5-)-methyltransferase [Actinomadura graeca]QXJ19626.1 DNA (cytosine-5-)-methyltransferase [Actinomadura graeca]
MGALSTVPGVLRAVSLFAGIGAFDLGARAAGMCVTAAVEIDTACRGVLAHHWPDLELYEDVREVNGSDLGPADVILAGWPCQDVSKAGQRAGLRGTRTGLYSEVARLGAELLPRWIVLENVPALLTSARGHDMYDVVAPLAAGGYSVAWRVLDAACFGLPHRRPRLFAVAHRGALGPAEQVLPDPHGCPRAAAARETARQEARARPAVRTEPYGLRATEPHLSGPLGCNAKGGHRIDLDSAGAYVVDENGVRRLTPVEYERLMGLPDDWTRYGAGGREQSDTARYRQVGNSLPVPVASWVLAGVAHAHLRHGADVPGR